MTATEIHDLIQNLHVLIDRAGVEPGEPIGTRLSALVDDLLIEQAANRALNAVVDLHRRQLREASIDLRAVMDERDRSNTLLGRMAVRCEYLTHIISGQVRNAN